MKTALSRIPSFLAGLQVWWVRAIPQQLTTFDSSKTEGRPQNCWIFSHLETKQAQQHDRTMPSLSKVQLHLLPVISGPGIFSSSIPVGNDPFFRAILYLGKGHKQSQLGRMTPSGHKATNNGPTMSWTDDHTFGNIADLVFIPSNRCTTESEFTCNVSKPNENSVCV